MGKLGARLRSILGRKREQPSSEQQAPAEQEAPPPEQEPSSPLSEMLRQRVRRVAEGFLDNEQLTADLDDSAAKELLDWVLNLGSQIVQGTAGVADDEQADEAMYPRLRATRRMMRGVNQWITTLQARDLQGSSKALNQIIEQAQIVYGQAFKPPTGERRARFLEVQSESLDSPPRLIANLRQLFTENDDA